MKKFILSILMVTVTLTTYGQSATSSPYSMYGLGTIADRSQSFSRGMNGVGIGMADGGMINYLNPASYSAIDSLTFLFDIGASLQITNYKEGNAKQNFKDGSFEYATGGFRLIRHMGMAFGILPYSNVGYDFKNTQSKIDNYIIYPTGSSTSKTSTFYGDGGLHMIFLGIGWSTPIKGLSVGMNANYLWGEINKTIEYTYSDTYIKRLTRKNEATVHNMKFDIGVQYAHEFKPDRILTAGFTYTFGHRLNSSPTCSVITFNPSNSVSDTTKFEAKDALAIPTELGFGLSYRHSKKWKVAVDYTLQKWSTTVYPYYTGDTSKGKEGVYIERSDMFSDRHKINIGGEYCTNVQARTFLQRIRYRAGIGYSTGYLKIDDKKAPGEFTASLGLGLPIINNYNHRSMLNIAFQYARSANASMITENIFRINIGLTFNERWFAKWRFE